MIEFVILRNDDSSGTVLVNPLNFDLATVSQLQFIYLSLIATYLGAISHTRAIPFLFLEI